MAKLVTLKKRAEFLRLRGGDRWACPSFVVESKPTLAPAGRSGQPQPSPPRTRRPVAAGGSPADVGTLSSDGRPTAEPVPGETPGAPPSPATPARFGFTITKQIGNAVTRNLLRRRFKAIVTGPAGMHARRGYDYVIVVRQGAIDRSFVDLTKDLEQAFQRVHHPRPAKRRKT